MCIAIYKPSGIVLDQSTYKNCFDANPDGAGFAAITKSGLVIQKGFFEFDSFMDSIREVEGLSLLVHFRIATHGTVNQFNCHPWPITTSSGRGFAVIHNGVLSFPSSADKSDTGHYVDEVLTPVLSLSDDALDNPAILALLERDIGSRNKIAIMRDDGKVWILNRDKGEEDLGCWFSNQSYKDSLFDADPRRFVLGSKWGEEDEGCSGISLSDGYQTGDVFLFPNLPGLEVSDRTRLRKLVQRFWSEAEPDEAYGWPEDELDGLAEILPQLMPGDFDGDSLETKARVILSGGDSLIDYLVGQYLDEVSSTKGFTL